MLVVTKRLGLARLKARLNSFLRILMSVVKKVADLLALIVFSGQAVLKLSMIALLSELATSFKSDLELIHDA